MSIMAQIVDTRRRGATQPESVRAQEAVDPVCGMAVSAGGTGHAAEVLGVTYAFCCAGCRAKFLAEPARYLGAGSKAVGT